MDEDECTVTSELYKEKNYVSNLKPTSDKNNVVSNFPFKLPPVSFQYDSDGDLIVERKRNENCLEIEHNTKTGLKLVGLQIWRGALLLADWLIYNQNNWKSNERFLELGSGTGITSIVAAMYAPVVCTDINKGGILNLIKSNAIRNQTYTKHPVTVTELDFNLPFSEEIETILPEITTILAADVIYDNNITDTFIRTIVNLLKQHKSKTMYIALEKRYVFTIDDLNTVAPCYEHFRAQLSTLQEHIDNNLMIEEVPIDFPQYFDYERVNELVLWQIKSLKK